MLRIPLKKLPRYECLIEASKQFPDLDPSACEVFMHLLRAGDEVFRVVENNYASHGLSQGRFLVLMLLLDKATNCVVPRTPAELADMLGVTRATITGLIDTLERDELAKREPDPDDRRMMSVNLTPKGRAVLDAVLPGHFRSMTEIMSPLNEHERKTLVRLLNKIFEQAAGLISAKPAPVEDAHAAVEP